MRDHIQRHCRLAAREYAKFFRWFVARGHTDIVDNFLSHLEGLCLVGSYPSCPMEISVFDRSIRDSESDRDGPGVEPPVDVVVLGEGRGDAWLMGVLLVGRGT